MSHIQKILERAERDGSIRPAAVPLVADVALSTPPAASTAAVATAPAVPVEAVFPIVPLDVAPATATVAAPARRLTTTAIDVRVLNAVKTGSVTAEQYRALRTRVQQAFNGRGVHTLAVTSATRGEGRTHTAASLALAMAQEFDRRVCVVDANLRAPQLRSTFGLPDGPGLVNVLTERARLEDALVHIEEHNLTVLPCGDATTQAELLGSTAMRRVMQSLRAQFDRIVIDAPVAVPVADVSLLANLVDGLMLVVRAGVTPKHMIHDAVSGIGADKLIGVVLNDAK